MIDVDVVDEEPWYAWRPLEHEVDGGDDGDDGDDGDGLGPDEPNLDSFLAVETLYAGFAWGQRASLNHHMGVPNLDVMMVHPAGRGGLVALVRDNDRVSLTLGAQEGAGIQKVQVCTLSGQLVREIDFVSSILGSSAKIFGVGWVGDDCLVLASSSGLVHAHHLAHSSHTVLSLGEGCEREGLAEMRTSPDGIFFRTAADRFGAMLVDGRLGCTEAGRVNTRFQGPVTLNLQTKTTPTTFKTPNSRKSTGSVHCFEVVPPAEGSGAFELIVAMDTDLVRMDRRGRLRPLASGGPYLRVCPSPDAQFVAALAATSDCLTVVDMSGVIKARVDLRPHNLSALDIRCLAWCGSEAVVACFEGHGEMLVAFVNSRGTEEEGVAHVTWADIGIVHAMSSEIDGVCVLGQNRVQLCRIVPDMVRRALGPGSTSPGALLHDARNLVGQDDVRAATELLNILEGDKIQEATTDCLGAAGWCIMQPGFQESLLRAGIYGHAFGSGRQRRETGPAEPRDAISDLARSMRILNALLQPEVGMPLTLLQYRAVGLRAIVDRLCSWGHFLLALRISESMEHKNEHNAHRLAERVLLAWAKRKISSAALSTDDNELLGEIRASIDHQEPTNRQSITNRPIEIKERRHHRVVSWSTIAEHALECGRPQLAATLIEMEPSLKKQVSVLLRLGHTELAMKKAKADGDGDSIWEVLCARGKPDSMDGADSTFIVGSASSDPEKVLMAYYASFALSTRQRASEDKFLESARAAAARLERLQRKLESSSGRQGFLGLSVLETIRRCYDLGFDSDASSIVKEFRVSERQAVMVQVAGHVDRRDWGALGQLVNKLQGKSSGLVVGTRRPVLSRAEVTKLTELAMAAGASEGELRQLSIY